MLSLTLDRDVLSQGFWGGVEITSFTLVATVVLELLSFRTVYKLWQIPENRALYRTAVLANLFLHAVLGIPVYVVAVQFFTVARDVVHSGRTMGIVVVHGVLYYNIHQMFHAYPSLYKYHRFHHRFNAIITPVSANAVSLVEYMVAYVFPFIPAAGLIRPSPKEVKYAVLLITIFNLIVHTPWLTQVWWPPFLVSPANHFEHHARLTTNYAAPIINIDWLKKRLHVFLVGERGKYANPP